MAYEHVLQLLQWRPVFIFILLDLVNESIFEFYFWPASELDTVHTLFCQHLNHLKESQREHTNFHMQCDTEISALSVAKN